jgi:hypothetical protein
MDQEQIGRLRAQYAQACEDERRLWASVKGMHPGQPGHNAAQWSAWLAAADKVRELSKVLGSSS